MSDSPQTSHHIDTLAIHAGQSPDPSSGAVMPPIVLSSTFAQREAGVESEFVYSRSNNPTRQTLERCLAALEGGDGGLAFSSGCAAAAAVFQALPAGSHVVAGDDVYGGTYRLLERVFVPLGLRVTWVDMADAETLQAAWTDQTRLIWVETPTNPLLKVVDLPMIIAEAQRRGIAVAVDNTFATPVLQRPIALGADLVVHSTTKYINGHCDVVGGAVITRDAEWTRRLRFVQNAVGAVPSPFDCFLVLRGIKTLPLRMKRHCETASRLADWLMLRSEVEAVLYPGLAHHPQHELAARQMTGFGGMISLVVAGGEAGAKRLLQALRLFTLAESLGGVESLAEHPASMTHASIPADRRNALGIVGGLVRLSVGLECYDDLRDDLEQALLQI